MISIHLKEIIQEALKEDIGMGDLTSESIFPSAHKSKGTFIAKSEGVIAGLEALSIIYNFLGADVEVRFYKKDGDKVSKKEVVATVEGSTRVLLSAERVILNIIQHLSGIATSTSEVIKLLNDESITVTDTRKTLPGLRSLQKYAVKCGGGKNHRFRLDDGVMIKDNHIKAAGSITKAVERVRSNIGHMVKIEVETESKDQVLEAVEANVDVIMLDNRTPAEITELVKVIPDNITVEVSGGITPKNINTFRGCGANVISLGWLTHSVKALDISFNLNT
ncbi:MAG TPA: carboxylating nicotinate-nucleotide diphosphorylase [Balneola sp.]|jgi:nicotinate-nucleotide pyrophosphorylase (carboxylating)|nr:nicotinate-nucleotide diphosphorylase (carboxylating) [Bacteroidota bacterium]MAC05501.1 nicotinate-nucleotide diphosphorylase (carboxylating) [Balneola sp.]MAB66559.1 nicotinate-nucleotide diphosphorylase (carboxylating) [Bacteroidota bacterium]MAO77519.1 nicotinate-nucleotide diphosphorylase (carboxylating) [Balneola sp.]MBF66028.1 nicotinate-nucleotide diphosphorylase (carboxylating) [Balneola sp.]|tara:strand:+ start:10297 stop:11130 length:834 start_codon:yes stop_codon:yes gene_type:complete